MRIKTRYFGVQEVDPQTMLFFPEGLPGFEEYHRFKLFHEEGERPIIHYLQSLDDPEIAFSVVEPDWLGLNYELPLARWESAVLKSSPSYDSKKKETGEDPKEGISPLLVLIMLSATQEEGDGPRIQPLVSQPLVINPKTRRGLQLRLTREDFEVLLG
ncbi:Flagellar assembly factor FliW [Gammaproteobacteria bacterium]